MIAEQLKVSNTLYIKGGPSIGTFLKMRSNEHTLIFFINFFFVVKLKVSASRMKNDFVHVAPSTGLTVCHSVTPIINDILDYLGANFTQNSRNIVFQSIGLSTIVCGCSEPQIRQFCLFTYPPRWK